MTATYPRFPSFPLGRTVITACARDQLHPDDVYTCLRRHALGDWGECGPEDWAANEEALKAGSRLFSAYQDRNGIKFWIITEADRSSTTILLPEDY